MFNQYPLQTFMGRGSHRAQAWPNPRPSGLSMMTFFTLSTPFVAAFTLLPEIVMAQSIPAPTLPGGGTATDPWAAIKNLFIEGTKLILWILLVVAFVAAGWVVIRQFMQSVRDRDVGGIFLYFGVALVMVLMVWFLVFLGDDILNQFAGAGGAP